ncbi:TPA: TraE/TraK family type IV conjugative transfer system protein, partial [Pseudomonas aeruginosa]
MKFFKMTKTVSRLQETSKVLSLSNLCTGFIAIGLLFLLYGKNEKIIIVPPNLQTTGWIDENEGSTAYMQSWASYIATLLGNTNPSSVNFVKSSLAPFLSPNSYQRIMLSIDDAISQINRDRVSLSFTPT